MTLRRQVTSDTTLSSHCSERQEKISSCYTDQHNNILLRFNFLITRCKGLLHGRKLEVRHPWTKSNLRVFAGFYLIIIIGSLITREAISVVSKNFIRGRGGVGGVIF